MHAVHDFSPFLWFLLSWICFDFDIFAGPLLKVNSRRKICWMTSQLVSSSCQVPQKELIKFYYKLLFVHFGPHLLKDRSFGIILSNHPRLLLMQFPYILWICIEVLCLGPWLGRNGKVLKIWKRRKGRVFWRRNKFLASIFSY